MILFSPPLTAQGIQVCMATPIGLHGYCRTRLLLSRYFYPQTCVPGPLVVELRATPLLMLADVFFLCWLHYHAPQYHVHWHISLMYRRNEGVGTAVTQDDLMKTLLSLLACLCVNMPSIVALIILNFCTQVASSSANACLWKSHNKDWKHSNYCYLWLKVKKEYFLVDGPLLTC